MNLLKEANRLFKEKKYEEAYILYKQAAIGYGEKVVSYQLSKCAECLDDETLKKINSTTIQVKKVNNSLNQKIASRTEQRTERKVLLKEDSKINVQSEKISQVSAELEFDYLLEYAAELRKIEMSETYFKIIKYLLLQFKRLSENNKRNMELHLTNVIKLTEDKELVDFLIINYFDLFQKLALSPKSLDSILGTVTSNLTNYGIKKYMFYDLHTEPERAISHLMLENPENLKKLNPEYFVLFCNLYSQGKKINVSRYLTYFNKYLSQYNLPKVKSINLERKNVLSEIIFEKLLPDTNTNLVSIIMSAFNAEDTIEYAITSLLLQTHKNIEILVCDDGSRDKTLEKVVQLAKTDHRIKVFKSNSNQGTYNIRNDMIKEANGEYVTFQDSDDYALPNRIELQVNSLLESGKAMCCTRWIRIKPSGSFVYFHDDILSRFCVVSSMVAKETLDLIPAFRKSLVAADTEFYQAMINTFGKEEIHILDFPLILGLWGDGSLTKQANLTAENSGFVAARRRRYSDIAARQRILGTDIIPDEEVEDVLKENKIFMEHKSVKKLVKGKWI